MSSDDDTVVPWEGSGEFDVMPFFVGDLSSYPHQTADGVTWDCLADPQTRLLTFVLAGDPSHIQVWRHDPCWLYLHWDGHKGQKPNGYTFSDGRWLRRMMRVGERIDCPRNRLERYTHTGEHLIGDSHGLPYSVTLVARYLAYPCGILGMQPAIEYHYAIGDVYRERFLCVEGWGLYQWCAEDRLNGAWTTRPGCKGLPIDLPADPSRRVAPQAPPLPTTALPVHLRPPRIEIKTEYPVALRGVGEETIIAWLDSENQPASGRVWLRDGSVYLRLVNAAGADQTGQWREVVLLPSI